MGKKNVMVVIPSESIFSNDKVVIPMADVQHIEKQKLGIMVITKHTRWDMEADVWANPIWLDKKYAQSFLSAWCYYRYEIEGIKEQVEN